MCNLNWQGNLNQSEYRKILPEENQSDFRIDGVSLKAAMMTSNLSKYPYLLDFLNLL